MRKILAKKFCSLFKKIIKKSGFGFVDDPKPFDSGLKNGQGNTDFELPDDFGPDHPLHALEWVRNGMAKEWCACGDRYDDGEQCEKCGYALCWVCAMDVEDEVYPRPCGWCELLDEYPEYKREGKAANL